MRILLLGFGNVGKSLARLIQKESESIKSILKTDIRIVGIKDSKGFVFDEDGLKIEKIVQIKEKEGSVGQSTNLSYREIIDSCDPDVVVDTTPTNPYEGEPSFTYIRDALSMGKHVVTTNKGSIALGFHALNELAKRNNVRLKFSGTVGGGTPLLYFARTCAIADKIVSVCGVLNSTSNYVITLMEEKKLSMDEALKIAVEKGYAERESSNDINGNDSALKLVILANYLEIARISINDVSVLGIQNITKKDIERAERKRKRIRLIAYAGKKFYVSPVEIESENPLAVVGPMNSLCVKCKYSGEKFITGKGAGGTETAVTVLRDIISLHSESKNV